MTDSENDRPRKPAGKPGPARPTAAPAGVEVNLGFGELFKGLGQFVDLIARMEREGRSQEQRTGSANLPGGGKAVWGVSVRLGLGGEPVVQSFGTVGEAAAAPDDPVREPLTDVFDEGNQVVVVAEVPGVDPDSIAITVADRTLVVKAGTGDRLYAKQLPLPDAVDPETIRHDYRNGILEVRLQKRREPPAP